jgi:ABC-type Fe3+/spermidine/putrescine transport system ATPase subunit
VGEGGLTEKAPAARAAGRPPVTFGTDASPHEILHVEDVAFHYGATVALEGLTLSIAEGEFVSLLGPSGCGKTTLLRIVAGLLRPSRGRVYVAGKDVTALPPERRPLNMVFQHLALFPHLSVGQNVGFGLSLRRLPREEVRRRVSELLELVGLAGFANRSTHELSGGQQQRVALARALITEPAILLLDEPLGALDSSIRKEMQRELKALQKRLNITFVFVTHDQAEAMSMSDRVVLMRDGSIVQDASPFDIYSRPSTTFAAGFLGETNLLEARVLSREEGVAILGLGEADRIRVPLENGAVGSVAVVSLRPEHIAIAEPSASEGLVGTIVAESFFGSEVVLEVESTLGLLKVRERARATAVGRLGEQVRLLIDPADVRVFVQETPN